MQAAFNTQRDLGVVKELPPFVPRDSCVLSWQKGIVLLTFRCCCVASKVQCSVRSDNKKVSLSAIGCKLAAAVVKKHGACHSPHDQVPTLSCVLA